METSRSAMAQQIAQAVKGFELQTGSHQSTSMTVVLCDQTLVITMHGALSPIEHGLAQSSSGAFQLQEFHRDMLAKHHGSLRKEIKRITGVGVCETATAVEPATGVVVLVSPTGTVVHVVLLDGSVPADTWSGDEPNNES